MYLVFVSGVLIGVLLAFAYDEKFGIHKTYRYWYLMCRNALEEINDPRGNKVLDYIGPRTSKREKWECE